MTAYNVLYIKSYENKKCSLDVLNCVNHIQKSLDREMALKGPSYLAGLFRLAPQIQSGVSEAKQPKPKTSYESIQHNESQTTFYRSIPSVSDDPNSQESLQITSPEAQNVFNEKIPLCIITQIDRNLPCAKTMRSEYHHQQASTSHSTYENRDYTNSCRSLLSISSNREISDIAPSVLKTRKHKLLVEYQEAMEPITSIDIPLEYEEKLISLLK
ncbi:hypothetical protein MS3_00008263 [Schistosoma haematobium]|uniref:Uncharacterized protein n=1 Tax=Schistosoma haematobium TaxID=6185 RepID=A0A094ZPH9_SCHHA|nr:hypothetical protein MS3_00008263 [Schistosoma haematobium]KAH9580993.1 hypothetical protein MS3_00008263 [Schistosoma haematobium]CAH8627506.1 unnamed protein product [Schistosoma haematobium]